MGKPVKIDALEVENVKRVKAVSLEPAKDGLTVIGGRNGQGKTSVLDAIAWALGGDKRRPSRARREGAVGDPRLKVVLDNGIVVERKGKNGALKVTDPTGSKGGQKLLDSFVGQLALDLPKFMAMRDSEKADVLLRIIGVGDELAALEREESSLYEQRKVIGQVARQKRGAADELPGYPDAPVEEVSAADLIREQQAILARNGENQRLRQEADAVRARLDATLEARRLAQERLDALRAQVEEAEAAVTRLSDEVVEQKARAEAAAKTAAELADESTAEIEASIAGIEETNAQVRANRAKAEAEAAAAELEAQYDEITDRVEDVRLRKRGLLEGAQLPLPGLSVEAGELTYNGAKWDCMSGSEQLRVATAIVRAMKPECGFVLLDKTEQMDVETLSEFAAWAAGEGLQVICTRVSTGDECSIVIEDGYAAGSIQAYQVEDAQGGAEEEAEGKTEDVKATTPPWAAAVQA